MAKKSHVRTLIGIQHVKGSKKLLKSEQKCFCLFFFQSEMEKLCLSII